MALLHRCNSSSLQRGVVETFNLLCCSCFVFGFATLVKCQDSNFTFSRFDVDSLTLVAGSRIVDGKIRLVNMSVNSNQSTAVGRALYPTQVQLRNPATNASASFRTSFTFSIDTEPGNWPTSQPSGIAWGVFPDNRTIGDAGRFLGLLNESTDNVPSNRLFAIEVDTSFSTFSRLGFKDVSSCHLGVNLRTMNSMPVFDMAEPLGSETSLCVQNRGMYTLNVRYDGVSQGLLAELLDIGGVTVGKINATINLYPNVNDMMYIGFSSSAIDEQPVEVTVLSWNFTSTFASQSQSLSPSPLPSSPLHPPSGISSNSSTSINRVVYGAAASGGGVFLLLLGLGVGFWCTRRRSEAASSDAMAGGGVAGVGPRRFTFKELCFATKNFNQTQLLGQGGSGSVYRGVLRESGVVVAVKVIQVERSRRMAEKEFQAEVSIISQIRHRNLVQLQGWCSEKGMLCLVYDHLPNGSLDSLLRNERENPGATLLPWSTRFNIVTGVASALAYLHEEIGQCILHRGLKPGNVLLDASFHASLADLGLARLMDHDQAAPTAMLAGTMGYMAPELPHTGRATSQTDVYSFGILVLEIVCGRRPMDIDAATKLPLLDCAWRAHAGGDVLAMADAKISDDADARSQIERTLLLGLLCSHPDPACRPGMRNARQVLLGDSPLPPVPAEKPAVRYSAILSLYAWLQLPQDDAAEAPVTRWSNTRDTRVTRVTDDSFTSQSKAIVRLQ